MATFKRDSGTAPRYSTKQILQAVEASGGMIYLAARSLGCNPATIYKRMQRNPEIEQAIKDKREEFIDSAETALKQAVGGGEAWAVCFTLKTIGRQRGYYERQEVDLLTPEQKVHQLKQYEKALLAKTYGSDSDAEDDADSSG